MSLPRHLGQSPKCLGTSMYWKVSHVMFWLSGVFLDCDSEGWWTCASGAEAIIAPPSEVLSSALASECPL